MHKGLGFGLALACLAILLGGPLVFGFGQTLLLGLPHLGATFDGARLALSAFTALVSTLLALLAALGLAALAQGRQRLLTWLCLPLLAVPHAAVGQALSLLLAPSGLIVRLLSPWATGYARPPSAWLWDQQPEGWTLILALAMKELPFFLILIYAATANLPLRSWQRAAQALGYGLTASWWHGVLPALLPRLWGPICLVLAFCLSVVDVAALVGPSLIKTYAHELHQAWISDTPPGRVLAGGLWLLMLGAGVIAVMRLLFLGGRFLLAPRPPWARRWPAAGLPWIGAALGLGLLAVAILALALLPLQSLMETAGRRTQFPDVWTGQVGLDAWARALHLILPTLPMTLAIGVGATLLSLGLTLGLLATEPHGTQRRRNGDSLLLVPLLIPQMAFLPGGAFLGLKLGLIPNLGPLVAVGLHTLFVLPYVFLILAPACRELNPAYARASAALGHGPVSTFFRVQIPILARPLLFAAAWGMAVSLALYLPTVFAGGGRIETVLTVGVSQLAGQGDRVRAVWGLVLLGLPLAFFALAYGLSALQARHRRGLRGG